MRRSAKLTAPSLHPLDPHTISVATVTRSDIIEDVQYGIRTVHLYNLHDYTITQPLLYSNLEGWRYFSQKTGKMQAKVITE